MMIKNLNGKVAKKYIKTVYGVELFCDYDDKLYLKNTTDKQANELRIDATFNHILFSVGESFFDWECEECAFDEYQATAEEYSLFCAMVDALCDMIGLDDKGKIVEIKGLIMDAQKPEHALDFIQDLLEFYANEMNSIEGETIH